MPSIKALVAAVYAAWGKRAEALKLTDEVSDPPRATPFSIATIYAMLGENDDAFEWLDRACHARSFDLVSLKVSPAFDKIRSDPRYEDLLVRVGFA